MGSQTNTQMKKQNAKFIIQESEFSSKGDAPTIISQKDKVMLSNYDLQTLYGVNTNIDVT